MVGLAGKDLGLTGTNVEVVLGATVNVPPGG